MAWLPIKTRRNNRCHGLHLVSACTNGVFRHRPVWQMLLPPASACITGAICQLLAWQILQVHLLRLLWVLFDMRCVSV